jgi:hypothetical protein
MRSKEAEAVDKGLRELIGGDRSVDEGVRLVEKAGALGDRELVPLLVQVAEEPQMKRVIKLKALEALYRLGQPASYFERNAQAHRSDQWRAYYSILMLAGGPTDLATLKLLQAIGEESDDTQIRGAVAEAEHVNFLADQLEKLQDPKDQATWLLAQVRGGWNPITGAEGGVDEFLRGKRLWVEERLFELSVEYPREVAEVVAAWKVETDGIGLEGQESYREYLCSVISKEARARYEELADGDVEE